jgi:AbrB family looped-hinge helix DNA binding protein
MASATVTSKGQITIPKNIRQALRLGPGDRVEFIIEKGGKVSVLPGKADIADLKGLLRRRGRRPVSVMDMERAIARAHSGRS